MQKKSFFFIDSWYYKFYSYITYSCNCNTFNKKYDFILKIFIIYYVIK